ncbi:MAG: hypothetical protein CVT49_04510 [candidate division Zixibacteria bacterium HGW-Zixibacteria-1]|nr:MAG: hypothetical protein CVT49_04510 [candidate division Zixibacteria bacterium HGW-Zixibacteria-1]
MAIIWPKRESIGFLKRQRRFIGLRCISGSARLLFCKIQTHSKLWGTNTAKAGGNDILGAATHRAQIANKKRQARRLP